MKTSTSKIFDDFFRNNQRCSDTLKKITEQLETNFGIDAFWYGRLHENGLFYNINNWVENFERGWENHCYKDIPYLINPTKLRSGSFNLDHDSSFEKACACLKTTDRPCHYQLFIRKEGKSKVHFFGFMAKKHTPSLPSFYCNNQPIIDKYIDYFLNSQLMAKAPSEESMVNIAKLKGHDRYFGIGYGDESLPKPERHSCFLKQICIGKKFLRSAATLSRREKEVLLACHERKALGQVADELGLSIRSIEFYLENAKNKLDIISRDELFECVNILKMTGFLDS